VLGAAGFFWEALLLWYLPSRIGLFVMMAVCAWLPHHPHRELGRYRTTRVTLFPLSTLLYRGHDHHVLHHRFPRTTDADKRPHMNLAQAALNMMTRTSHRSVARWATTKFITVRCFTGAPVPRGIRQFRPPWRARTCRSRPARCA